ncbi:DUF3679 domain-containing protein [Cohnella zeiphila]|uniref:DUF3679 domain-containing protein n=1 Tax=Cohnella zeiphila TaxID=2761120 RepID=A0A7X0SGX0_9BACL|nr:DUF3679 domain-containing protein [Cohnella zeiphila]MBB6729747.1 DUF3679 domain-containing protein [Cohnella zeiphila]
MARDGIKLLLAGALLLFAVMFGMELASSGISNVYGPVDPSAATAAKQQADDIKKETGKAGANADASGNADQGWYGKEPDGISVSGADDPRIPRLDHKPVVDRIAGGTADLLQSVSKKGIQLISKLFSKTTE